MERIIIPHMFMDDLENLEINHKNKLYGWANKNGKVLEFETLNEKLENGRRLFTIAAVVDGKKIAEGKHLIKKMLHRSQHRWPWKNWESLMLRLTVRKR